MADLIDLSLHRSALDLLQHTLERRGLGYFLGSRRAPFTLDEARLEALLERASRGIGREAVPQAREACYRALRRRLLAQLAQATLSAGA